MLSLIWLMPSLIFHGSFAMVRLPGHALWILYGPMGESRMAWLRGWAGQSVLWNQLAEAVHDSQRSG